MRDAGNRWVFPDLLEEGLEPWPGVRLAAFNGSPEATHAVDVSGFLDRGIASLEEHRGYLQGLGDGTTKAADVILPAAEATGARIGVEHAVAFEVLAL